MVGYLSWLAPGVFRPSVELKVVGKSQVQNNLCTLQPNASTIASTIVGSSHKDKSPQKDNSKQQDNPSYYKGPAPPYCSHSSWARRSERERGGGLGGEGGRERDFVV